MRATIIAIAAVLGLAGAASADPIEGTWQTQVDDGAYAHISIVPCGTAFCGTIVRSFNSGGEYQSPNHGKQIVRSMVAQGGGKYAGKVWRPSNNKVYTGKVALSGDRMKLSGCIAGGLLCSSQTWARLK